MMNVPASDIPNEADFKLEAQKLWKEQCIKCSSAHEVLARSYGFKTYAALRTYWSKP